MVARMPRFFTTEQVTMLLGLDVKKDKWRVVKFAESEEYGIKPSISAASGSGTRRLYDLEDVCEIALALRLLESGLRAKAVGKVIRQLREKGKLSTKLKLAADGARLPLLLAVNRTPEPGKALDVRREQSVEWLENTDQIGAMLKAHPEKHFLLVPLRAMFSQLNKALQDMESNLLKSQDKEN
jgi:DNA-binding transcriptional MerR regulator